MNFIEEYSIPKDVCNDIVDYFYKNKSNHEEGEIGEKKIDISVKDSIDLGLSAEQLIKELPSYTPYLGEHINLYLEKYMSIVSHWGPIQINEGVNIQYYNPCGGFKVIHNERDDWVTRARELVFMTYLTDTPNGGTYFPFQEYTTECIIGKTVIWPAGFTHPHVGELSNTHEKMIITGWFSVFDSTK